MEAWVLRRCITVFSRVAKRPHTPRSGELRTLMSTLGLQPALSDEANPDAAADDDGLGVSAMLEAARTNRSSHNYNSILLFCCPPEELTWRTASLKMSWSPTPKLKPPP